MACVCSLRRAGRPGTLQPRGSRLAPGAGIGGLPALVLAAAEGCKLMTSSCLPPPAQRRRSSLQEVQLDLGPPGAHHGGPRVDDAHRQAPDARLLLAHPRHLALNHQAAALHVAHKPARGAWSRRGGSGGLEAGPSTLRAGASVLPATLWQAAGTLGPMQPAPCLTAIHLKPILEHQVPAGTYCLPRCNTGSARGSRGLGLGVVRL